MIQARCEKKTHKADDKPRPSAYLVAMEKSPVRKNRKGCPREKTAPGPRTREGEHTPLPDEPKGIASRRAALELLALVRDGHSLDDALSKCRTYQALDGLDRERADARDFTLADRGFARTLATLVLRRRGTIDHLIGPYLDRPLPPRAIRVMDILRTAAVQSLFLETPPHAAVSLATALAKERRETAGYAGLVNAIARKIAAKGPDKIDALPARIDTPAWLWRSWERAYGPMVARKIALAHRKPAPLDLRFKSIAARDGFAATLGLSVPDGLQTLPVMRLDEPPSKVSALPGYTAGDWWVQDLGAGLPVALMGDVAGRRVLDLCAAPGGKTLQLAAAGAEVTAVDKSEGRMERVTENLARTGLTATTVIADAFDFRPDTPFDAVLLDAPCSATGTIRRHPDLPWAKSENDVETLARLQTRLIRAAERLVKPGGQLVYCTCSIQPDEGEDRVREALAGESVWARNPISADAMPPGLEGAITREGDVRLLPHQLGVLGGLDGFFIARLTRL